ncbi:FtsX-like permease family protein [Actinomadura fulvescens]|uniref:FtsX-like permease family protein n=1 Tax=Actinomadura fulvescens TaxID=46160 RepID=UPI0031E0CD32
MALTTFGVGLGVLLLLLVASLPQALEARVGRIADRSPRLDQSQATLWMAESTDYWRSKVIKRELVATSSGKLRVPGVQRFPAPGQAVLSPALARLVRDNPGSDLAARYGPISGIVAADGLAGPEELIAYVGATRAQVAQARDEEMPVAGFGQAPETVRDEAHSSGTSAYVLAVSALLAAMLIVLLATCARMSALARDRRVAAMRLVGASAAQTRKVLAGEALVAAVVGTVLGIGAYLVLRPWASGIGLGGISWYDGDFWPGVYGPVIVLGVPILSVMVATTAARRAIGSPLAVRRAATTRLATVPRLMLFGAGVALQVPALRPREGQDWLARQFVDLIALLGAVVTVLAFPLVLPALIRVVARALSLVRPVAARLGARRLEHEPTAASRVVGSVGLAVVVLGVAQTFGAAVALANTNFANATGVQRSWLRVEGAGPQGAIKVPGVRMATRLTEVYIERPEAAALGKGLESALVADCRALPLLGLSAHDCGLQHAVVVNRSQGLGEFCDDNGCRTIPRLGQGQRVRLSVDKSPATATIITPSNSRNATPPASLFSPENTILFLSPDYPGIAPLMRAAESRQKPVTLVETDGRSETEQHVRQAVLRDEPAAQVTSVDSANREQVLSTDPQRAVLSAGAVLGLLVAAFALVAAGIDAGWERRKGVMMMATAGAPLVLLRRAHLWFLLVPLGISTVLSLGVALLNAAAYGGLDHVTELLSWSLPIAAVAVAVTAALVIVISARCLIASFDRSEIPRSE